MTENSISPNRITYRRLNQALTALGFTRQKTDEFTAYREAKHGALIVLPVMSSQTLVGEPHLVAVRNTVALKGVATTAEWDSLLLTSSHRLDRAAPPQGIADGVQNKTARRKAQPGMALRKKKIGRAAV